MHPLPAVARPSDVTTLSSVSVDSLWKETQECLEVLCYMFSTGQQLREAAHCGPSPASCASAPCTSEGHHSSFMDTCWLPCMAQGWQRPWSCQGTDPLCWAHHWAGTAGDGGVPASPDSLSGWIIWPGAGNWCPVPSCSGTGVRLPLP